MESIFHDRIDDELRKITLLRQTEIITEAEAKGEIARLVDLRSSPRPAGIDSIQILKSGSYLDKSQWGEGEWRQEPDYLFWIEESSNLPCAIVRTPIYGSLCGYVGVPSGHPYYRMEYGGLNLKTCPELSYSDFLSPVFQIEWQSGILENYLNCWFLGFHGKLTIDLTPGLKKFLPDAILPGAYRNLGEVFRQAEAMAKELTRTGLLYG